jgi:DNA-directed RNA polymerase subunit alpha
MIILLIYLSNFITCKCVQDDPNQDHLVHYSRFVVSPLIQGEANTLGTAIRRSLLGLQGYCITSARILGASHEYSVLDGVLEPVHDILVNLKKIIITGNKEQYIHGSIIAEGMGNVTASYIKFPENIQIINPNQHIATLTKNTSQLYVDINIHKQDKYKNINNVDNIDKENNSFLLNYNILPVRNVNYTVHPILSTDKQIEMLVIEIWTNKSIAPTQALYQAASDLMNLLQIFFSEEILPFSEAATIDSNHTEKGSKNLENSSKINKEDVYKKIYLDQMNISNLNLSTRTYNSLHKANIYTVSDLLQYTEEDLLKINNFGRRSAEQVIDSLKRIGINLK